MQNHASVDYTKCAVIITESDANPIFYTYPHGDEFKKTTFSTGSL